MCRLLVFKGAEPIQLQHLITKPCHSIINQAFDSRLRLDATRSVNGDGFGVGWYDSVEDQELGQAPCIFTSVTPAWNNQNLHRLAEKIKSPLVFAHVRASTAGALSETNCHPWRFGKLMWMHNGSLGDFNLYKRRLQESLTDELFLFPQGNTDSEWAFAVFLGKLDDPRKHEFTHQELKQAMLETIKQLNAWAEEVGSKEPSLMNFCVTDGRSVVCTRYISSRTEEAASLYFSSGTSFDEYKEGGFYRMVKADKREKIILVASEPLTFEKADWMEIPTNTLLCITPKMNVLQQPIVDQYYIPPARLRSTSSSTAAPAGRQANFATQKGFPPASQVNALHAEDVKAFKAGLTENGTKRGPGSGPGLAHGHAAMRPTGVGMPASIRVGGGGER